MKYKLLKDLPHAKAGEIIEINNDFFWNPTDYPDFFEPIVEKKRYEDLEDGGEAWYIDGNDWCAFLIDFRNDCRSETFLTREEAEDEHKRREWAVRPDRFIPKEGEKIFYWNSQWRIDDDIFRTELWFIIMANLWLLFRTEEDCEKAIKEHDLVRLFYTIR